MSTGKAVSYTHLKKGAVCVLRSGAKEIGRILVRAGRLIAGGLPALLLLDVLYRLALRLLTPLTQRALPWAASRADAGFVTAQDVSKRQARGGRATRGRS